MDFSLPIDAEPQIEDMNAENQAPDSPQASNQVAEACEDDFSFNGADVPDMTTPALAESTNSFGELLNLTVNPEDLLLSQERKVLKLAEMAENGLPTDPSLTDELATSMDNQPLVSDEESMPVNHEISGIAELPKEEKVKAHSSPKKRKSAKKAQGKSSKIAERHVTFSPDVLNTDENNKLPKTPIVRRSKRLSERSSHEKNQDEPAAKRKATSDSKAKQKKATKKLYKKSQ